MIVLPDGENRTIVYLHSSEQNTGMWRTDGRTDRQNCCGYYSGLHCQWYWAAVAQSGTGRQSEAPV